MILINNLYNLNKIINFPKRKKGLQQTKLLLLFIIEIEIIKNTQSEIKYKQLL